jgi:hypothetical protein
MVKTVVKAISNIADIHGFFINVILLSVFVVIDFSVRRASGRADPAQPTPIYTAIATFRSWLQVVASNGTSFRSPSATSTILSAYSAL